MSYWVQKAFAKHKGALHRALHVKKGERIPVKKLTAASHMKGKIGQRARLALTARKFHH